MMPFLNVKGIGIAVGLSFGLKTHRLTLLNSLSPDPLLAVSSPCVRVRSLDVFRC